MGLTWRSCAVKENGKGKAIKNEKGIKAKVKGKQLGM